MCCCDGSIDSSPLLFGEALAVPSLASEGWSSAGDAGASSMKTLTWKYRTREEEEEEEEEEED